MTTLIAHLTNYPHIHAGDALIMGGIVLLAVIILAVRDYRSGR